MILRALTLWEPWLQAILDGHKMVENRSWEPSGVLLDGPLVLALHAGRFDRKDAEWCRQTFGLAFDARDPRWEARRGKVLALAVVEGVSGPGGPGGSRSPWAFGPRCWWLRFVTPTPDLPALRGHQGLWSLPDAHEAALRPLAERIADLLLDEESARGERLW